MFFWLATPVDAGNQQITFQGKLTNSSGNTVSDGTYYVKLSIYDAATGGTCQYTASSTCSSVTSTPVTVANGIFSINLGDTSAALAAISPTLFNNSALYLGITVCSGPSTGCDSEMTPRKRLTAAPYAFNADYLSGLATSTIGGTGSYVPVTDSSGNLKITNSFFVASTTVGQFGVGTTTVPSGIKNYIESVTASDKLLVIRANSNQSGSLQEWQNNAGTALVSINSSGNVSASGTLATFGNATIGGHLYPSSDNLYDVGASSTQWRYGNFQGGILVANGSTTSTLLNNSLTLGQAANFNAGKFYIDSSGNVSTSGSVWVSTSEVSNAFLVYNGTSAANVVRVDNDAYKILLDEGNTAYEVGVGTSNPSEKLTVIGNIASADGSTTSTLTKNSLTLGRTSVKGVGTFYVDSSGNVSASSSLYTFGNVTSTGIIYALGGLISSASSTFSNTLNIRGAISASSTFQVTGDATLYGALSATSNTSSLRSVYLSGLTVTPNTQAGTLYFNSSDGKFYGYTANGTAVDLGSSGTNDWGRFSSTYGAKALMTSSTYPVWFDGAVYASSTLTVSGSTNASSSVLTGTTLMIGRGGNWGNGVFSIDANGGVSTSGTLNVAGGPDPIGSVWHPTHKSSIVDAGGYTLDGVVSVFVSGNYAYVLSSLETSLSIIDISNPASTTYKGAYTDSTLLAGIGTVFVSGNYAYVVGSTNDYFAVIDVSNPSNPVLRGSLTDSTNLNGPVSVFVSGNYAYVACGPLSSAGGLAIIDISNPANPVIKSYLNNGTGGAELRGATSVFVSGKYAYVTTNGNATDALEVVDISNPLSPVHAALLYDSASTLLSGADSVFVSGNYAYVAAIVEDGLEIVDVSNPTDPVHKGSISDGTGGASLNNATGVFVSGNYAYVASYASNALEVVDISNPANPVHKGAIVDGQGGAALGGANSVFVSGNYAYVAAYTDDALEIVDISGATISNARIGALSVDTLQTNNFAQFDQGLLVRGGLNISGPTQLLGEVSIGGGRATSTNMGGGGLTIFTNQTSSTLTSRVFDASGSTGFIFNSGTSTWTGSDRNLVSFQTGGSDKFLFAADGSMIVNKASSYNSGYLSVGSTGSTSVSGTLRVFGGATTGGLLISATNATTTFYSYATNAAGSAGFVFNSDITSTTIGTALDRVIFAVQSRGANKLLVSGGGNVYATAGFNANSTEYGIADVAEYVNLVAGENVDPGDVVVVDKLNFNQYKKSSAANMKEVAGVISDTGAFVMGASGPGRAPLALAGLVMVKVTDENGPIVVGDYLTTASKPGYAMRFDADAGITAGLVGMALEPWESGDGKIKILVNKGLAVGNQAVSSELNVSQNGSGQLVWGNDFNLHLSGRSILDVLSIQSKDEKWTIDEEGCLVVKVKTQEGDKELYGLQSGQDKEVVFSGSSQLENGMKRIELPAIDKEIIDINALIKVSVTLTGEANGVFVTEKSYEGFTVKELSEGASNATFDWLVIAKRRGEALPEDSGNIEELPVNQEPAIGEEITPSEPPDVSETPVESTPEVPEVVEDVPTDVDTIPASEEIGDEHANSETLSAESAVEPAPVELDESAGL
ncbi:MAG: hypothetical protein HY980_00085 [Candidatus Magasanikbacteria bacterium]|nr:hypothetical protein [Candidatus Magasanikbacteria bacterium]